MSKKKVGSVNIKLNDLTEKVEKLEWIALDPKGEINIGLTALDFGKKAPSTEPQASPTPVCKWLHFELAIYLTYCAAPTTSSTPKKPASNNKNAIISSDELPPMPALEKLETEFEKFLGEIGVYEGPQFKQMKELPAKNKWMMICQGRAQAKNQATSGSVTSKPEYWVQKLKDECNEQTIRDLIVRLSK